MKIKITKLLKFILLSIIFLGCEKDVNNDKEKIASAPFESKALNLKELPTEILNYIIPATVNNSARSSENLNDLSDAIFATQDIIKTTDNQNITNYSISSVSYTHLTLPTNREV